MSVNRIGTILGSIVRCPACDERKWDELSWDHEMDLIASQDPRNDPTHRTATDQEWWDWVLSGGRD